MLCSAAVIESRYISRALSLPSIGELLNIWQRCGPAALQLGKVFFAMQHDGARLHPVVEESRLHLRDDRPFHAVVRIAPLLRCRGVAVPLIGNADAAGETDLAIDDEELAMRAVVGAGEIARGGRSPAPRPRPPSAAARGR